MGPTSHDLPGTEMTLILEMFTQKIERLAKQNRGIYHYIYTIIYIPWYIYISHYIPLYPIMYIYIYTHIPLYTIIYHYIPLYPIIYHYIPLYTIIYPIIYMYKIVKNCINIPYIIRLYPHRNRSYTLVCHPGIPIVCSERVEKVKPPEWWKKEFNM